MSRRSQVARASAVDAPPSDQDFWNYVRAYQDLYGILPTATGYTASHTLSEMAGYARTIPQNLAARGSMGQDRRIALFHVLTQIELASAVATEPAASSTNSKRLSRASVGPNSKTMPEQTSLSQRDIAAKLMGIKGRPFTVAPETIDLYAAALQDTVRQMAKDVSGQIISNFSALPSGHDPSQALTLLCTLEERGLPYAIPVSYSVQGHTVAETQLSGRQDRTSRASHGGRTSWISRISQISVGLRRKRESSTLSVGPKSAGRFSSRRKSARVPSLVHPGEPVRTWI